MDDASLALGGPSGGRRPAEPPEKNRPLLPAAVTFGASGGEQRAVAKSHRPRGDSSRCSVPSSWNARIVALRPGDVLALASECGAAPAADQPPCDTGMVGRPGGRWAGVLPGHCVVVCIGRIATAMRYALSDGGP